MSRISDLDRVRTFQTKQGKSLAIRYAKPEDAGQIVKSIGKVISEGDYLEEEADEMNSLREEIEEIERVQRAGGLYAVPEIENRVVGAVRLKRGELEMNRHVVDARMWLNEAYRGMGIGRLMLEYAIEWAKDYRFHKMTLDVFSSNKPAIGLYKKCGFAIEGNRKDQFILNGTFVDEIFMSRFL